MQACWPKRGGNMRAIDTNVIIRVLADDHVEQAERARTVLAGEDVLVLTTVLLETAWVLKSVYRRSEREVADILLQFVGLPSLVLEEPARIARALEATKAGMGFADALHLAGAAECDEFLSFDRHCASAAYGKGFIPVREP